MPYEEFYKIMNQKAQELKDLKEFSQNIKKEASLIDQQMMLAVYIDQVKIADYGSVQYVKASDYKSKHHHKQ